MKAPRTERRMRYGRNGISDLLGLACARESEARRVLRWPLEYDTVFSHVFKCVCCGRTKPKEQRLAERGVSDA